MMVGGIGYAASAYQTANQMGMALWNGQTGADSSYGNSRVGGEMNGGNGWERTGQTGKTECQTCKSRKYVDGSNEGNVSFKAPGHISPESSASTVMSHEQEHVANAKREGNKENAKLISATVSLQMAVCPECGRSYVEGGTTNTTIQYTQENPYAQNKKAMEKEALLGNSIDIKL